jgi:co-chaperonin GroES (HSP10)
MDLSQLRPLQDRVLVERVKSPNQIGSVILPDSAKRDNRGFSHANIADRMGFEGTVRAVGHGRLSRKSVLLPPEVKVGERVILHRQTHGDDVSRKLGLENESALLTPDAILAVIDPEGGQFSEISFEAGENENAKEAARSRHR